LESAVCDVSAVPFVPVKVSHTSVSPAATVTVAVAVRPLAVSVTVIVAEPALLPSVSMLAPNVAPSFVIAAAEVVHVNEAVGTIVLEAS
jgi:hypothetical protein